MRLAGTGEYDEREIRKERGEEKRKTEERGSRKLSFAAAQMTGASPRSGVSVDNIHKT